MAKYTYNRVKSAMAEDENPHLSAAFTVLPEGAKSIALQSGHFSNLYIRGERKGMAVEEAARELTERSAACVSRKLRKIDMVCAVAFLTEYINRQRKEEEPTTTEPNNTTTTVNANETTVQGYSHAAHCLELYLHNTSEIYDRYTVPAIERVRRAFKAGEHVSNNAKQLKEDIQEIEPAISAAARLVRKYDHLSPTAQDIEQVTRNYAAYIVEQAHS